MTRPIRFNADYEIALFEKKNGSQLINESLEFLALYLENKPLWTLKKYHVDYLHHVEKISGWKPQLSQKKPFDNWWGSLTNIPLEMKINSKEFSAKLSVDSQFIQSFGELKINQNQKYLAKNPFGMSGLNFIIFEKGQEETLVSLMRKTKALIIEPLYKRIKDFSHYILPDGKMICYENLVDDFFQYKGTIFTDIGHPDIFHLSFYKEIKENVWITFNEELKKIIEALKNEGVSSGYSVDSFTYLDGNNHHIRAISEINYRKSMGLMAWLISNKYAQGHSWSMLILGKWIQKKENMFHCIQERLKDINGCIYLSPGDTRFELFFLVAHSPNEGKEKFEELKRLLPDCQFSVEI